MIVMMLTSADVLALEGGTIDKEHKRIVVIFNALPDEYKQSWPEGQHMHASQDCGTLKPRMGRNSLFPIRAAVSYDVFLCISNPLCMHLILMAMCRGETADAFHDKVFANAGVKSLELHPAVDFSTDHRMRDVKLLKGEGLVIPSLTAAVLLERR